MKKKDTIKLSLNKETVSRLDEMETVTGGIDNRTWRCPMSYPNFRSCDCYYV